MFLNPFPILKKILQNSTSSQSIRDTSVNFRFWLSRLAKPSLLATVLNLEPLKLGMPY